MTHISFFDAILELIVGISCLFIIAYKVNQEMNQRNIQLTQSQEALRELIDKDPLTGLWHKRYFDRFIKTHQKNASIATIELSDFDTINSHWGPAVGDLCLKEVSKLMKSHFDEKEGLFRINEDSFLVVSPFVDEAQLTKKVQGLKNKVSYNPLCAPIITLNESIATYHYSQTTKQSD